MKKHLLLACFLLGSFLVSAQINSKLTIPLTSANVQIVPVEPEGFLVMDFSGPKLNNQQLALPVTMYDDQLQQKWKNVLPVTAGLQLQHYQIIAPYLFMAFAGPKNQFIEMYRVDLSQGHFQRSQYAFSSRFNLEVLAASENQLWASGTMTGQGVLFALHEQENNYKILPTAYTAPVMGIRGLNFSEENGQLTFLLLTKVGKQQSYVLRSLHVSKNRVTQNLELSPPEGLQLTQVYLLTSGEYQYLTGTFYKKNPELAAGVYIYKIAASGIETQRYTHFKELPQFSDYTFWSGGLNSPKSQTKKGNANTLVDDVVLHENGIVVSLELLEKRYQAKGALQQEMERNQLVNNLDQDQFGRRALDQSNEEGQTAADRISQRSATDILQYRYRNALVAQPTFLGLGFERSVILTFDDKLQMENCRGIKAGTGELIYLGAPNTFLTDKGVRQLYDKGGTYYTWLYHPDSQTFDSFTEGNYGAPSSRFFRISSNSFVVAEMKQEAAGYLLTLKKGQLPANDQ